MCILVVKWVLVGVGGSDFIGKDRRGGRRREAREPWEEEAKAAGGGPDLIGGSTLYEKMP